MFPRNLLLFTDEDAPRVSPVRSIPLRRRRTMTPPSVPPPGPGRSSAILPTASIRRWRTSKLCGTTLRWTQRSWRSGPAKSFAFRTEAIETGGGALSARTSRERAGSRQTLFVSGKDDPPATLGTSAGSCARGLRPECRRRMGTFESRTDRGDEAVGR